MAGTVRPDDCLMCATEDTDPANVVFRDDLWAAEVVAGYEVPGWIVLRVRRHAEGIGSLTEDELDVLGRRARDVVTAVGQVTSAPATYYLVFGENYRHYHALIVGRGEDVPPDRRGGNILQLRSEQADLPTARALVPALREAYARAATGHGVTATADGRSP